MQYYYPTFADGSFKTMINYLRPSDKMNFDENDLPEVNEDLNWRIDWKSQPNFLLSFISPSVSQNENKTL